MSMMTRVIIVLLVSLVAALPAKAQTTTFTLFANSVFSESGVTDSAAALGSFDGAGSTISGSGDLVLQFDFPLIGDNIVVGFQSTGINVVGISVGSVIGGVATFSGEVSTVSAGAGNLAFNLGPQCSAISSTGCSLVRIRNAAIITGAGLVVDGVSGVSNTPEPSAWALMIAGFIGLGWRLKQRRHAIGQTSLRGGVLGNLTRSSSGMAAA